MNSKEDGVKRRNKKYVNPDSKRVKKNEDSSEEDMEMKPICKYGEKCYQKNSYHLKNFRHPHRESEAKHEEEFKVLLAIANDLLEIFIVHSFH